MFLVCPLEGHGSSWEYWQIEEAFKTGQGKWKMTSKDGWPEPNGSKGFQMMPVGKQLMIKRETDGNIDFQQVPAWTNDANDHGKPGPDTSLYSVLPQCKCTLELSNQAKSWIDKAFPKWIIIMLTTVSATGRIGSSEQKIKFKIRKLTDWERQIYDITYMWNLRKCYKWTYLQNGIILIDTENKLMVTKGDGRVGGETN